MKVLYVLELHKTATIGADKYERIWYEAYSAGLIENKLSGINEGLVLVVQKCIIYALLWQDRQRRFSKAWTSRSCTGRSARV